MKDLPDVNQLLKKMVSGEETAWKSFLDLFHPLIQGTINRYISYPESEDIANEVYVHLMKDDYRLLRKFHGEFPSFLLYIQKISQNIGRKEAKKINRRNSMVNYLENPDSIADHSTFSIEIIFNESEERIQLKSAIESLEITYLEVLSLRAKGYKAREIAEILSLPISTVLTKMRRGKQKLKKVFSNEIKS